MLLDGRSAGSICRRLGLSSPNILYRWKWELIRRGGSAAAGLDGRVRELEAELRRVERERDILKNARHFRPRRVSDVYADCGHQTPPGRPTLPDRRDLQWTLARKLRTSYFDAWWRILLAQRGRLKKTRPPQDTPPFSSTQQNTSFNNISPQPSYVEVVRILLENDASLRLEDRQKHTVAELAKCIKSPRSVRRLIHKKQRELDERLYNVVFQKTEK